MNIPKSMQWSGMSAEKKKRLEQQVEAKRGLIRKEPAFATVEEATKEAVKIAKKNALHFPSVWKEPKDMGGKFVVIRTENRENAMIGGYEEVVGEQEVYNKANRYDTVKEV